MIHNVFSHLLYSFRNHIYSGSFCFVKLYQQRFKDSRFYAVQRLLKNIAPNTSFVEPLLEIRNGSVWCVLYGFIKCFRELISCVKIKQKLTTLFLLEREILVTRFTTGLGTLRQNIIKHDSRVGLIGYFLVYFKSLTKTQITIPPRIFPKFFTVNMGE